MVVYFQAQSGNLYLAPAGFISAEVPLYWAWDRSMGALVCYRQTNVPSGEA